MTSNRRVGSRRPDRSNSITRKVSVVGVENLGPLAFKTLLRNWWRAPIYNASTGTWAASAGTQGISIGQANSTKRPTKTASNAAFGSKATVDSDGVNDDLIRSNNSTVRIGPNTIGILFQTTGNVAGDYLVGQYATVSYQFYRVDEGTDMIITDPSSQSYAAAGVANVHLFLFSKNGTQLTTYKDGVSLGVKTTIATFAGQGTDFYLFSAGAGFIKASVAELFTIDRDISAAEAIALTTYFRSDGYPL